MVITVDDLPAQRIQNLPPQSTQAMTELLVSALQNERVPAMGFVNEDKLFRDGELDPDRVRLLELWLDVGLELGNHTFSHPDLHTTPLEEFQVNLLKGEEVTRPLAEARGLPFRYFRHPFLHTGTDLDTKTALEDFLDQRGYRIAPVTVDNSEWIFGSAFARAVAADDMELQARLGDSYVAYMMNMVRYYEDQSRALFDREIPQILLVHANALNAAYLGALLEALRDRGYRFIDLPEALEDSAYRSPDTYVGPGGITWLHRWALTRGVEQELFQGEPRTPMWVQSAAGIEE